MTRTVMGRVAWVVVAAVVLFACARPFTKKESTEPASTTTATAPAPAPVVASPPLPTQLSDDFEDPIQIPVPGPPFARENRNPEVILKNIPKDQGGSVDWVRAFKDNIVHPRESLEDPNKPLVPPFDFNIDIPAVGAMPNVVFPHLPHTYWLDCGNCHPNIFVMKKGANPISMVKIVNGEFCGRCHGRVAFPISNCARCHVKPKS
jgi:c(7)-type cytochrome triheme protein